MAPAPTPHPHPPIGCTHCIAPQPKDLPALLSCQTAEWSFQLLFGALQACVYICERVNILGKAASGGDLHNVKCNCGCQQSSGKTLDSRPGSRNEQKPDWPVSFCCRHSHFFLVLLLIRAEFSSGNSPREKNCHCRPLVSVTASDVQPSSCVTAAESKSPRVCLRRRIWRCGAHVSQQSQWAARGFTVTAGSPIKAATP